MLFLLHSWVLSCLGFFVSGRSILIFSKSNLLAVLCSGKNPPLLRNVHFTEDGSTVAFDGKALVLVSPVRSETKSNVPLTESAPANLTISAETVKEVLKNMPSDKLFDGKLEHTDLNAKGVFATHDGKRGRSISGKVYNKEFIDYETVLKKARSSPTAVKVVLNRKRLASILAFLDAACPDKSGEAPVYLEFTEDNDVFVRAVNPINDQRGFAYMTSYKTEEGQWLEADKWERDMTGEQPSFLQKTLTDFSEAVGIPEHKLQEKAKAYVDNYRPVELVSRPKAAIPRRAAAKKVVLP